MQTVLIRENAVGGLANIIPKECRGELWFAPRHAVGKIILAGPVKNVGRRVSGLRFSRYTIRHGSSITDCH